MVRLTEMFKIASIVIVTLAFAAIACAGQEEDPPTASFSVDVETGSAPLVVQFTNTSLGSVNSLEWDFGDGVTSTDEAPSHRYTIDGSYDVKLTASGPVGSDTNIMSGLITIEPGPPINLEISAEIASLAVREIVNFVGLTRDEFGNVVPSSFAWSTDGAAGSIDENGVFTAGTEAGEFPDAVAVSVPTKSGELVASASITVVPGPVAKVEIDPPSVILEIGDTQSFVFKAFDAFDNETTPATTAWTVPPEVGTIDSEGTFTGGIKAGEFAGTIRFEAIEGTTSVSASADVEILPDTLDSVDIVPSDTVVGRLAAQQFSAKGSDKFGNIIPDLEFIWKSTRGAVTDSGFFISGMTLGPMRLRFPRHFEGTPDLLPRASQ